MGIYYRKIFNSIICFYVSVITTVMIIFFVYYDAYGNNMSTMLRDQSAKAERYAEENKTAEYGRTVFFGDSITECCDLDKYYPEIETYNRGISGDTTKGMLNRVENNVINIRPSTIVFLGGTNDLGHGSSPQTVADNIDKILEKIYTALPKCKVIVQSVYPVNPYKKPPFLNAVKNRKNSDILIVNSLLPDICQKYNAKFLDIHRLLVDSEGNLDKDFTMDGLHINDKGYKIISKTIKQYLNI